MPPSDPSAVVAFVAVVEHHGFRGAAAALGMPKSTVSQKVAQLEERLGAQLLVRTTRSVALTDIGQSYYREVAPAIASLAAADGLVADLNIAPSGRLRMTIAFELGQMVLGDVLKEYARRHPDVRVEVDLTDRMVSLVEEGYDLAIRVGPLDDSALVSRRLVSNRRGLWASASYLDKHGTPARPRDLVSHRCLVMTGAQAPTQWTFQSKRKSEVVPIEPFIAVNSYVVLRELCVAGLGIARLPYTHARQWVKRLVSVLPEHDDERHTYAVYPQARRVSPALRAMVDLVAERFATMPWFNDSAADAARPR